MAVRSFSGRFIWISLIMLSFPGPLFMASLRTLFQNLDKLLAVTAEGSSDDARKLAVNLSAIRTRIDALEEELDGGDFQEDFLGKPGEVWARMKRWSAVHTRLLDAFTMS